MTPSPTLSSLAYYKHGMKKYRDLYTENEDQLALVLEENETLKTHVADLEKLVAGEAEPEKKD